MISDLKVGESKIITGQFETARDVRTALVKFVGLPANKKKGGEHGGMKVGYGNQSDNYLTMTLSGEHDAVEEFKKKVQKFGRQNKIPVTTVKGKKPNGLYIKMQHDKEKDRLFLSMVKKGK